MLGLFICDVWIVIPLQVFSRWTRTPFLGTVSRSSSPKEKRRALTVRRLPDKIKVFLSEVRTRRWAPCACCASGSLSEEAPPPPRGMAMVKSALSARHVQHPLALARSLPVSVPVWGCKSTRAAPGDSSSGERVRKSFFFFKMRAAGLSRVASQSWISEVRYLLFLRKIRQTCTESWLGAK